jgi:CRP-like cAMP-binding protein
MPRTHNNVLAEVSPTDLERLRFQVVPLMQGQVLASTYDHVNKVYFPYSGIISSVVELEDGSFIETGMIGNDGVFGVGQALNSRLSLHKTVVQVPGLAAAVAADHLKAIAQSSPHLLSVLSKYEQFFTAQVQQTTACNALHTVEQRMCKWLVRMYDLAGSSLPLTQDFMAQMMGVRRTSVTFVANQLQKEGIISYSRGRMNILSMDLLQRRSCECHEAVRTRYQMLFRELRSGEPGPKRPDADRADQRLAHPRQADDL